MESENFNKLFRDTRLLDQKTAEELKKIVEKYPSFQMGWLLYLKNLKLIKSPEYDNVLKKVAVRVSNRKLLYKFLNKKTGIHTEISESGNSISSPYFVSDESHSQTGESLIDKFLSAKPEVMGRGNNEKEHKSNQYVKEIIDRSLIENDEIITETLALLLFQQKNYEKAQEAYKKLSLKYPEKSVYFASRIKEIEHLKNK